ncbi:MAG: ABC transporter permease [Acidimicrobiales bacterium]
MAVPLNSPRFGSLRAGRLALERWLVAYRRTWWSSLAQSFVNPLMFLLALGFGLGSLVDDSVSAAQDLGGLDYVQFLAPGLMVASGIQIAGLDAAWPVMGAVKWDRLYPAQLATPLRVVDVMVGHLAFMMLRVLLASVVFLGVTASLGLVSSALAPIALVAAVAVGFVIAALMSAFSVTRENETGSMIGAIRFVIGPMFLFSGTFFPVDQLPIGVRWLAWITPLWHGVEISRDVVLGGADLATAGHGGVLALYCVVAWMVVRRAYEWRLAR